MAVPTLPDDKKREETLNPGQKDYDRRFNDIVQAEEQGTFDDIADNYDKTADSSQSDRNINKLSERESEGDKVANDPNTIKSTYSGKKTKKSIRGTALTFVKKRGALVGILAALGVSGGLLAGFFGPASMLINLAENATLTNDSSSTALQHRFMKVFGFSIAESDPVCVNNTKNIKCKMGKISNSALTQLEKKGVTPYFDNDTDNDNRKKTGYPSKNPTGYTIDLKDGSEPKNIAAKDLTGFLAKNPKVAAKILGVGGAINLRLRAWSGKHIGEKLYKPMGIDRNGGLADGSNKNLTPTERLAEITKKLREKIPGSDNITKTTENIEGKIRGHLSKAGKGGTAYVTAVAGCIGIKAPSFIAAGVAAVQLAQVMPVGMETILSPGSKAKASGVDVANSVTADDIDNIGTLLTNKTPRESDGKMSSALDSPILQASIGVNKSKPAVSKDYTPGYSVLTNPATKATKYVEDKTAPACNAIMSTAAMYTAMALSTTATIALSSTVIGGVIKVIAETAASYAITEVVTAVASEGAKAFIVDVAKNDKIKTAKGEALGDVIGISMASMFSAGGMARNLPVLKESELADFQTARLENEAFEREMDIASLHPLDISSKYTFLGSIVNNAQLAVLTSGSYNGNILSALPGLINFSKSSLSVNTGAASFSNEYCGYAKDFGLTTEDPANTPAINMAGLPCTGLTSTQINMSTEEAIDLVTDPKKGWIDESKSYQDTDTIQDMVTNGYIVADTPLSDFINSCSSAETGDYIFSSAGCTVLESGIDGVSSRSLEAMSVFLLDYQEHQMINGTDSGEPTDDPTVAAGTTDKKALAQKILDKNKIQYLANAKPLLESYADGSVDPNSEPCGVNINVLRMIDAVTDKHNITISSLNRHCINRITGSGPSSRHYNGNGSAFDISSIDGTPTNGRNSGALSVISIVMPILSEAAAIGGKQSNIGQINCGSTPALAAGVQAINDSCNHLHLDVPPQSDPSLKFTP
jgi:hypothetical protein